MDETGLTYEVCEVAVPGGYLHVGRWGGGSEAVVAAHGLTATHLHFAALAEQLGERYSVFAPDLRGRGRSRDVGEPFGMAAHADDLLAVLDHFEVPKATVVAVRGRHLRLPEPDVS